jgi:hypothetical protein
MNASLISVSQSMTATPTLKSSGKSSPEGWSIHALLLFPGRDEPACVPRSGSFAPSWGVAPYDFVGYLTSLVGMSL